MFMNDGQHLATDSAQLSNASVTTKQLPRHPVGTIGVLGKFLKRRSQYINTIPIQVLKKQERKRSYL